MGNTSSVAAYGPLGTSTVIGVGDFDGNGVTDVAVNTGGTLYVWYYVLVSGSPLRVLESAIAPVPDGFNLSVGVADFDNDRQLEAVVQDSGGQIRGLEVRADAPSLSQELNLGSTASFDYRRAFGVADMDGDGDDDLVIRHRLSNNNTVRYYLYDNAARVGFGGILAHTPASTDVIVGAADINGDRNGDIVIATPSPTAWYMQNLTRLSQAPVGYSEPGFAVVTVGEKVASPANAHFVVQGPNGVLRAVGVSRGYALVSDTQLVSLPAGGSVVAYANFDRDAYPDLVYTEPSMGGGQTWRLASYGRYGLVSLTTLGTADTVFTQAIGVGDFDSDANLEFVLRDTVSGQLTRYEIGRTTGTILGSMGLGNPMEGAFNLPVGVGDADRDGDSDILVRNPATGAVGWRYYNGFSRQGWSGAFTAQDGTSGAPATTSVVNGCVDIDRDGDADLIVTPAVRASGAFPARRVWLLDNALQLSNNATVSQLPASQMYASWPVVAVR
jgi:hypothetical protein